MNNIERQLKNDINKSAKYDFDAVKRKCNIQDNEPSPVLAMNNGEQRAIKKAPFVIVAITLAALLLSLGLLMLLKNDTDGDIPFPKNQFIIIDINPSFEIEYNKDGKVVGAKPYNEDGELVLSELSLESLSCEGAISMLFDKCVELGYISSQRDDNAIMVSAVDENGNKNEEMTQQIKESFSQEFSSKKILGVVITGIVDSTLQPEAEKYGIDVQKYAFIKSYLDMGGELDTDKYDDLSIREIRSMIYEKQKEQKNDSIKQFKDQAIKLEESINLSLPVTIDSISLWVNTRIAILSINAEENAEAIASYTALVAELNQPQGESFSDYLNNISGVLDELALVENDSALSELLTSFNSSLKELIQINSDLQELNKTAEEKIKEKKDAVGELIPGTATDVDKWQSDKEGDISSSWFDHIDKWEQGFHSPKPNEQGKNEPDNKNEAIPPQNGTGEQNGLGDATQGGNFSNDAFSGKEGSPPSIDKTPSKDGAPKN